MGSLKGNFIFSFQIFDYYNSVINQNMEKIRLTGPLFQIQHKFTTYLWHKMMTKCIFS